MSAMDLAAARHHLLNADVPPLSEAQRIEMRNASIAGFESRENLWPGDPGTRQARRADFLAQLDQAAGPVSMADPAVVSQHTAHGIPIDPKPDEYRVTWANPQRMTPQGAQEVREFLAAAKFSSELGQAFAHRLSEIAPKIEAMSPAARQAYFDESRAFSLRQAGSQDALDLMIEEAKNGLRLAGENKLARILETSVAVVDPWMLASLQNHFRAQQALRKALGKNSK
jgi:hypothetical protein